MGIQDRSGSEAAGEQRRHWRFEIAVASLGIGLSAILLAIDDLANPQVLEGAWQWGAVICTVLLCHLVIGIVLIRESWEKTPKNHDPGTEEQPLFRAAFAWSVLYLIILCWAAFGTGHGVFSFPWGAALSSEGGLQPYLGAILLLAFAPLVYGFHLVAVEATDNTGRKSYLSDPDEEISWVALAVSFLISGFVGVGAWAAGNKLFTMDSNFGLIAVGAVVSGFLVFIILANILGFREPRGERPERPRTKTAGFGQTSSAMLIGIDAALVRIVAPLSGSTLPGFISGKLAIVCVLLPLSALGFALPAPMGLLPIGIAVLLILAMGRRWSWVEDDREKALRLQTTRTDKFRIGFNNDMRDEALLGYAFLFVLVPLALRQIQLHFDFFAPEAKEAALAAASSANIIDWLNFFGGELAKGVPIVDWFDIYDIQQERPFEPKDAAGRHIIFGSRLMIDIVIIAALLQAIGIMQRNKAQENLFKSGQVDFFDPFMEKKILLASYQAPGNAGDAPLKEKWKKFFEKHRENSRDLDRGDFYYNPRRLNELALDYANPQTVSEQRIKEIVDWLADGLVIGSLGVRLSLLREQISRIRAVEDNANDGMSESGADPHARRRFERFLDDVLIDARQSNMREWGIEESKGLSRVLADIAEDREHDAVRQRAFALLARSPTMHAAIALAARLVKPEDAEEVLGLDYNAASEWGVRFQRRQEERTLAAEQFTKLATHSGIDESEDAAAFAELARAVRTYIRTNRGNRVIVASEPLDRYLT
jgi:hypothetical protein